MGTKFQEAEEVSNMVVKKEKPRPRRFEVL